MCDIIGENKIIVTSEGLSGRTIFKDGEEIPGIYACKKYRIHDNKNDISPAIKWNSVKNTKSYRLPKVFALGNRSPSVFSIPKENEGYLFNS